MKTNKISASHRFGHNDDGPDFSSFNGFLNAILAHHQPPHAPSPPPHIPNPPPHTPPTPTLEFRSFDGSGNNLQHTEFNSTPNTNFVRLAPANFADGISEIRTDLPNPRDVSNIVVAGHGDDANPQGLSGMMYAWGQFVDHDLDLEDPSGAHLSIPVNQPDADLPTATEIPFSRALIDPASGHDGVPAIAYNTISGWMDASQVYGSDAATAASLRSMSGGHMKTSSGNLLPTVLADDPTNPGHMVNEFLAGDVRAQENPDLTALQTMFIREHNYQADLAHQKHPTWTDEQLYQYARAVVTAEIQHITYDEFLPHLLGASAIAPYHGYDPNVDPRIMLEFAGAAYRLGHSLVSAEIDGISNQGQDTSAQNLKDAFFESADAFKANGGADGLLRHLTNDLSNKLDVHIVDDLRNFLFAPPDALDLASINIERGRDLGLASFNGTREALGLQPYTHFSDITSDVDTANALSIAYGGDINKVDLWTGGLAEDPANGGMVGQTFGMIIAMQFENLRDGDRLWYENQGFDAQTLATIHNTTLSDIIVRNTDTNVMQDDAFVYYDRHGGTQSGMEVENPNAQQLVIGSKGFDTLIGGPQGDMLVANTGGTQVMTGGAGADQFIVAHNMTVQVTDFHPGQDKIVFNDAGSLAFNQVHIKADHANTVVEANGNHIVLLNVNPLQLHPADFVYHA